MDSHAELNVLIDKAASQAGSYYKLARLLGLTDQKLSDIRAGRRNAQPEDFALFAAVAGVDPVAEMTRAMLRKHEGSKKGELLMKALGKASLATGVAVASVGAHASAIFGAIPGTDSIGMVLTSLVTMYRRRKPSAHRRAGASPDLSFC